MFNKKEIAPIIAVTIILTFAISLVRSVEIFFLTLASIFGVIILNLLAKKIMSYYLDSEIETRIWEIKRYGFMAHHHFKKPFPMGVFLPIFITIISVGYLTWFAPLVFDVKAKIYRAAKRHGLYSFSEMTEYHLGLIAAAGIIINLLIALISYFIGFQTFAKLNIFYAFFNMIPISNLDGNKIFFGNLLIWTILATITATALIISIISI